MITLLKDLSREKNALDAYLKLHQSEQATPLLTNHPELQKLLTPIFTPLSDELLVWQNMPYECNTTYPEQLNIKTSSGKMVRSKSEALIDMALYNHKIPFRYECPLHLGKTLLYPDFTIRHPNTGVFYYWEHFGLMDDPAYRKNTFSKLKLYCDYNIIPSIQLITTYETKEHPLSPEMIEKIIAFYFM